MTDLSPDVRIRVPARAESETVGEELLAPSFRASAGNDPAFHRLDEAAVENADCDYWLDRDDATVFVAETTNGLAGAATARVNDSPPVYARGPVVALTGLYVKPTHRREGIATALVNRVEAWGRARGCEYAALSVHVNNDAARSLYDRLGFEVKYESRRKPLD